MLLPNEQDVESNSEESTETTEPAEETQDTSQSSEESASGGDSDVFTTVNRDGLTTAQQQAFDNMNRDYTQKTQAIAAERRLLQEQRDMARLGEFVANTPNLNQMARRVMNGESIQGAAPAQQSAPTVQDVDAEQDPRAFIAGVVRDVMGEFMPGIQQGIQGMNQYVARTQADLDFENLVSKYPAAAVMGKDALNMIRAQMRRADGSSIGMEEALALAALENPNVLAKAFPTTTAQKPATTTGQNKSPSVEKPSSATGADLSPTAPSGVKALQARVTELQKSGQFGLREAVTRALSGATDKMKSVISK